MSEQHMALEGQTLEHFSVDLPKERARRQYEQYGEREATQGKSLKNALLLVDGSSYLYRAWHAMPDLRGPNAEPTGALYGFISMLRRLRTEYSAQYSACIFDAKGKTFREDLYPAYKAHRAAMRALGWPLLMIDQVEADDVIGTLARNAERAGMRVIISTGDKDLAQLVTEQVTLINTMSNETLDCAGVRAKFGVPPALIIDYLTLIGDSVDHIPGVAKCGPVTARRWLNQYGSLDGVIQHAPQMKGAAGENLRRALDFLPTARKLITVRTDCPLALQFKSIQSSLAMRAESQTELIELYTRYGFKSWLRELQPATRAPRQYDTILDWTQFDTWLAKIEAAELTALDTETTSLDALSARLVGLSFAVGPGCAAYIPLAHR